MYKKLSDLGVKYIYHFTDRVNIKNIINHDGILSYHRIQKLGINGIQYGGNDWSHEADEMKGLDNYVHLCFRENHPMLFRAQEDKRIKKNSWLKIKIDILKKDGLLYTSDVSNKSGVETMGNDEALKILDFEAIYSFIPFRIEGNFERKSQAEKYEILIPDIVPLKYIEGLDG